MNKDPMTKLPKILKLRVRRLLCLVYRTITERHSLTRYFPYCNRKILIQRPLGLLFLSITS